MFLMFSGLEKVEMVFELDSLSAEDAVRRSFEVLGLQNSQVSLYQEMMSAQSALERVVRDGRSAFNIETDAVSIHFSTIKAYQQQLLTISRKSPCELSGWEEVVGSFLGCKGFTQACVLSGEYTFWQNAADPLQYQAAGRSYDGLPLVSNGLPSPLEKLVIDTSHNPGRRIIKIGYVEMVGHAMWFGQPFWNRAGNHRRQDLLSASAYMADEIMDGMTRVVAHEGPFADETTKEAQENLRRLLFG
ncbi:hypothetical protein [Pinirhizobacter soli]|uniref:hypothetical protein n=1 Tax=Pinirhizobacter soli TaxID=2786953 RepID=UPI00202A9DEF|nr:hypothetical protein [Pinirhizobacter soli]